MHALDDDTTRPNKTPVLDDHGTGAGGLKNTADPDTAAQVDVTPTWAQDPTVAQVSTMVPRPTCAPMLMKLGMSTAPGST